MKQEAFPMSRPNPSPPARVIDFHCHMLEETVFAASTNKTVFTGFGATPASAPRPGAQGLMGRMYDPRAIIADMDARGIDVSVVSSSTVLQGSSWAEPALDLALCRTCNDQAADWARRYPGRFVGSFVLPMQDVGRAVEELDRCTRELGLKVANLSSSYGGVYLGDPGFMPVWERLHDADATTWVHPEGVRDPWFQKYALWNSLGQSIEEAKCMASLVYEGVMTRLPGLKVVMAHGGGYFAHYMGRLDRNTLNRPDTVRNTGGRSPSELLRSFHYDTCVYDPKVLRVLVERVGVDRLVMGSDYPVGESDPVAWLRQCGLAGDELAAVAGGNAAKLLGC
ncbi:MAG: amidohydrolase [Alcaligenaceae bacterium]|nr:amidohydrolase [Alcaligenaceae bacterium SAGV5]MPS53105.1 amidohydrolase [Alcaligenaceae bacterium SAGV3]MPT57664.1 amidohydrolase [Alcaligenaceae bacterium]